MQKLLKKISYQQSNLAVDFQLPLMKCFIDRALKK